MFTLPELPYAYDALEPIIDEETMHLHHDKHHQTYVNNLNAALEGHEDLQNKTIEELLSNIDALPEDIRTAVRNNGGGHYNHSFTWKEIMPKSEVKDPMNFEVGQAIVDTFGSFENFKNEFSKAAATRFGSGYAWLVMTEQGELAVISTPNQDTPLDQGLTPIMEIDVWEHAYYLNYNNRRPEYIEKFFEILNWEFINDNYLAAK